MTDIHAGSFKAISRGLAQGVNGYPGHRDQRSPVLAARYTDRMMNPYLVHPKLSPEI